MQGDYTEAHIGFVLSQFGLPDSGFEITHLQSGHINCTMKITYLNKEGNKDYTLQAVNTYVFRQPIDVMKNIQLITDHIKDKLIKAGYDDYQRRVLRFKKTITDNNNFLFDNDKVFWRCYRFINHSRTFDTVSDTKLLYNAGKAFGDFQKMLSDFPMEKLKVTIPDFHNTKKRLDNLFETVKADEAGRVSEVASEIDFFKSRYEMASKLTDMQENGEIPLRVTHNDTKYNNVLLDVDTGEAICVIDLDTVMPGLSAHDFGDAIRFAASTALEDEVDLSKVELNMESFEAFTKGFIGASGGFFTKNEIDNMALGAITITLELASRFLADYINGDKYFKIHYPKQNLDRARNQMKLVTDMEKKYNEMNEIVQKYSK